MGNRYQQKPDADNRRKRQPEVSKPTMMRVVQNLPPPSRLTPSATLRLQHTIGNQAVQRLLPQLTLTARVRGVVQTKLTVPNRATGLHVTRSAPTGVIQRYAAREHVRFGEVESMITPQEKKHTVKPDSPIYHPVETGESASKIATKYGISQDFLIARNAARYQVVDTPDGPKPVGFTKGDVLVLPGKTVADVASATGVSEASILASNSNTVKTWTVPITLKEFKGFDRGQTVIVSTGQMEVTHGAWASQATGQKIIKIQGIEFTYGQVIALGGDLYGDPEHMFKADKTELEALKALLVKEAKDPKSVTDDDWDLATGGRYLKLAEVNTSHYGPHDRALTPVMSKSDVNHKSEWEKYHRQALVAAQNGDKDKALGTNAFADHFLTDAFAAGHLFNKEDVMARFEKKFDAKAQETFFHDVAYSAWSKVGDKLDKYETYDTTAAKHWNISFPEYFQRLLQGIYADKDGKGTVLNMVVLMIHDDLNKQGVEVENQKGDKWSLSGDGKLNDRSLAIGRQAVAQSQVNVLNSVGKTSTLDFPALFKSVWDFTPRPTKSGVKLIDELISRTTNPANPTTVRAAVDIIVEKIDIILKKLVERKKLKKA